jgi:hypothetical protein
MSIAISILYLVTYYLTPAAMFGRLADYHIEVILAALALATSIPSIFKSSLLKTSQFFALIGLAIACVASTLVAMRWVTGAIDAFQFFVPNAFAYFLVVLNCRTKKRLQLVVAALLLVCLNVIAHGVHDLSHVAGSSPQLNGATESSYFLAQANGSGTWIYRLMGPGQIHDPNDFGQFIVCVIPLVFIFWRAKRNVRNFVFVVLPVSVLLVGLYLTYSRGAVVALAAIAIVAAHRRIGLLPSVLAGAAFMIAAMALNATGGRDISAQAGSDRTALWGEGLQILKTHPILGIGFGQMPEYLGLTAHNSIVVCAGELGLFGLFFWCMFLFPTLRDARAISRATSVGGNEGFNSAEGFAPDLIGTRLQIDDAEIIRLGRIIILSLTGFLVGGFFLSRAFVLTLFLLGGMAEAVFEMALQRGMISPRLPLARVMAFAAIFTVSLVLLMYVLLRITNLMR